MYSCDELAWDMTVRFLQYDRADFAIVWISEIRPCGFRNMTVQFCNTTVRFRNTNVKGPVLLEWHQWLLEQG